MQHLFLLLPPQDDKAKIAAVIPAATRAVRRAAHERVPNVFQAGLQVNPDALSFYVAKAILSSCLNSLKFGECSEDLLLMMMMMMQTCQGVYPQ